jgi:hypothetical protein
MGGGETGKKRVVSKKDKKHKETSLNNYIYESLTLNSSSCSSSTSTASSAAVLLQTGADSGTVNSLNTLQLADLSRLPSRNTAINRTNNEEELVDDPRREFQHQNRQPRRPSLDFSSAHHPNISYSHSKKKSCCARFCCCCFCCCRALRQAMNALYKYFKLLFFPLH